MKKNLVSPVTEDNRPEKELSTTMGNPTFTHIVDTSFSTCWMVSKGEDECLTVYNLLLLAVCSRILFARLFLPNTLADGGH